MTNLCHSILYFAKKYNKNRILVFNRLIKTKKDL